MGVFAGVELDELVLTTPRLTLRPWARADAEAVAEIMTDRPLRDHLPPLPDPYTLDDAIAFVTGFGDEGRSDGTGIGCAVIETATGTVVGSAALRLPRPRHLAAEVGYWVGRAFRGHGYATEVTRALAEWAFAHGVARVELFCAVGNLASVKSALNAGFRSEGILHDHLLTPAGPADVVILARLAADSGGPTRRTAPPLPDGGLTDGTVRLRVMAPGDEIGLGEQEADPVTQSWEFTAEPRTALEHRRLCAAAALQWLVGAALRCAIVDVATGSYAGMINLRLAGPPQIGGIGYAVHPAFRGRGYTARALRLLTAWAFDEADFARLELGAKIGNIASQKAALAAGFETDGVRATRMRNPDGTFTDEVRFAALNPRYTATRAT